MKKHSDPRHIARKTALKILFEQLFRGQETLTERVGYITKKHKNQDKVDTELLGSITRGVQSKLKEIDEIISDCAPEWPLDQIAKVDLSVLRIAVYEILNHEDTPTKVAIDEAVELAKEYGGNNSSKFVNGVLGSVVKKYGSDT